MPNDNIVAFGSYFSDEDEFDEQIGKTIMFWIRKMTPETTTAELLSSDHNLKAFFWNDLDHMNDEIIPMTKLQWIDH